MNELPNELVIEIFEKIDLKETSLFIELSKINKRFYFIYKRYFEEKVKKYFKDQKKYIPLQFWFNRNTGLALPLIALEYGEIKININI